MGADELAYESVAGLAARIRCRDLSPVEVVDWFIARIESRNPALNALVVFGFEEARARARAAEQAVMSGAALGALHGVPVAIKDCFDFKPGWRNTFGGVPALKDYVATGWSLWPEMIERAGAIIIGKTNSPAFGFRGTCDNYLFGPTRNPFDLAKNSGGSSGGSAAAVAAGLLPLAEGGDGGGSIRIPAAWCGVYGYQHSFGKVPLRLTPNLFGSTSPYIYEGPLTRTVGDAALVLSVTAGYHPDDPHSYPSNDDFIGSTQRSIRGMRIAYTGDFGTFPVQPVVATHIRDAVRVFEDAGASVEAVDLRLPYGQRELCDLWCRMIVRHSLLGLEGLKRQGYDILAQHADDLPPQFRHWLEIGRGLTTLDQLQDQAIRSEVYVAMQMVFARYDLVVSPTLACLPVDNADDGNTVGPSEINGEAVNPLIGWCLTYVTNFTGHPAASVPAGLSPGGCRSDCRSSAAVTGTSTFSQLARNSSDVGLGPATIECVGCPNHPRTARRLAPSRRESVRLPNPALRRAQTPDPHPNSEACRAAAVGERLFRSTRRRQQLEHSAHRQHAGAAVRRAPVPLRPAKRKDERATLLPVFDNTPICIESSKCSLM